VGGVDVRLLLSKNPAGWMETLELLDRGAGLVIGLNANTQDGGDTSWIWDVSFESVSAPRVVCTGARASDMALRLLYAGVEPIVEPDMALAVRRTGVDRVDLVANYTAFQEALSVLSADG
jgi:UDP-N-acetylmuramyl tripeptide synthase